MPPIVADLLLLLLLTAREKGFLITVTWLFQRKSLRPLVPLTGGVVWSVLSFNVISIIRRNNRRWCYRRYFMIFRSYSVFLEGRAGLCSLVTGLDLELQIYVLVSNTVYKHWDPLSLCLQQNLEWCKELVRLARACKCYFYFPRKIRLTRPMDQEEKTQFRTHTIYLSTVTWQCLGRQGQNWLRPKLCRDAEQRGPLPDQIFLVTFQLLHQVSRPINFGLLTLKSGLHAAVCFSKLKICH